MLVAHYYIITGECGARPGAACLAGAVIPTPKYGGGPCDFTYDRKKYMFTVFLLSSTMLSKFLRKGFASEFRERLQNMCKPVWSDDTTISLKKRVVP